MNVLLTFDYELFFGSRSGTVQNCLIRPTERLMRLSDQYDVKMTFFLDAGFLWKLRQEAVVHPSLRGDVEAIKHQILAMVSAGHDLQFHVHPHWEHSFFLNNEWTIVTDGCYKLSDFEPAKVEEILENYYVAFQEFTGLSPIAFRAGGWCIQPFSLIADKLKALGIRYDSSVMPGVSFQSAHYAFDFTTAPDKEQYSFEQDVCLEEAQGSFTELPISSMRFSPLFFWRLYVLGRLFPTRHKMCGDGDFVAQPGRKRRSLTSRTIDHVSTDGYFASKLEEYHKWALKNQRTHSTVIGHPKSMTEFSFEKLEQFIARNRNKLRFITFKQLQ